MKNKITEYILSLSEREQKILMFFSIFIFVFIFFLFYYLMSTSIEEKKSEIKEKQRMMIKISSMKREFKIAKLRKKSLESKVKNNKTNINSYISGIKDSVGVEINTLKELKSKKIGNIKKEKIELSLRRVELPKLMTFLYALENRSRFVFIESLSIKKRYDRKNYNATIVVATLKQENENE
jgi:type II secretory pathway component PulM